MTAFTSCPLHLIAESPLRVLNRSEIGGSIFLWVDIQRDSQHCIKPAALLGLFNGRTGSYFAGWVTCWSSLMAILYQYMNPIIAVTDTMRRRNHEPNCNRMIQGGLVSWNCIRGFLQLNPRPRYMFGFLTFSSCPLKRKWHGVFLF